MASTYVATVRESLAAANKRHLGVFNAPGSGKVLVLYRIKAAPSPTQGAPMVLSAFRLLSAPTGGDPSGMLVRAWPADIAGGRAATPPAPAEVVVSRGHTAGNTEIDAFGLGVVVAESVIYEAPLDGSEQMAFPEGYGFEVRQSTYATQGSVGIMAVVGLMNPGDSR